MLSKDLESTLNDAFKAARTKRHEFVTVEHLLLALVDDESAQQVLKACGADLAFLTQNLNDFVDSTTPLIPGEDSERDTQPTLGFQRVLQRAVFHVQSSGKSEVTGANVLVAIFSEQESQAVFYLKQQNVARIDVVNFITHGISKVSGGSDDTNTNNDNTEEAAAASGENAQKDPLEAYATNLNTEAEAGRIDPLIGRSEEVERVVQILARRRKNNPLLVGESGVGKTAIAEGLAKKIVDSEVPDVLDNAVVYSLDMGSLLAGTKYRGDFEKRFKSLLAELKKQKNAVLFIDEIHTIIGAGAASGGVMDASNLLKPLLARGDIKCMGSTTYQEFRGIFDKDRALSRRFQKIDVVEPSIEDTYKILKGLKGHFEEHHELKYTDSALKAAAELAGKYINDRFMPDKAIDVIDEAGAYQRLQGSKRKKQIGVKDIEEIVSKIARIPAKTVSTDDKEVLMKLDDTLKLAVFGQDDAISQISSAIKLNRAGLTTDDKPIGSFLFAGPTGVGKTELCKQLASNLGVELIRFDMSEYMERHTVSRLIGAPPGYVGFDQGGLLTDAVTKNPHAVVLLDEIEKAHPDVFNLLLQVMDHGTLTDNNGRSADFRNIILIMTTNAGAEVMNRSSIGFTKQDHSTDGMEQIKRMFTPEFRNRLDSIVQFGRLPLKVIKTVVDKFLTQLQAQLDDKRITLDVSDEAVEWLAKNGYDEAMGARPMARIIHNEIKKPLAEMVLFGELSDTAGTVHVDVVDDKLSLEPEKARKDKQKEAVV